MRRLSRATEWEDGYEAIGKGLRRSRCLRCASGSRDLAEDAVLQPLLAPPVNRRHLFAADERGEVQMIAAGEPGLTAAANLLAFFHLVADVHPD